MVAFPGGSCPQCSRIRIVPREGQNTAALDLMWDPGRRTSVCQAADGVLRTNCSGSACSCWMVQGGLETALGAVRLSAVGQSSPGFSWQVE